MNENHKCLNLFELVNFNIFNKKSFRELRNNVEKFKKNYGIFEANFMNNTKR